MRWITAAIGCALALAAPAVQAANSAHLDLQLFMPTPGATNFLTAESGEVNAPWSLSFGGELVYGHNLLQLSTINADGSAQAQIGALVKNRLDLVLMASMGLWDRLELGLALPIVSNGGFESDKIAAAPNINLGTRGLRLISIGDLRVVPKVNLVNVDEGKFALALVGTVVLPTSLRNAYAGEGSVDFMPMVAMSARAGIARFALDVGARWRKTAVIETVKIGDELFFKAAAAVDVGFALNTPIELIAEVFGYSPLSKPFGLGVKGAVQRVYARAATPVEANLGFRITAGNYLVTLGGGGGLSSGYGAPVPRIFLSAQYYSGKTILPDMDNDGIPDEVDVCPDRAEDYDKFEDTDGCPEIDNDKDGVLDEDDQCPNEPEDRDGFEDEDGCPDPDNDKDGILDVKDTCPNEPEDKDGILDEDGCPETDADKDGIPDNLDKCPLEPEDLDGFEDFDGCPELDNDKDGLPDLNDLCPNHPEDKDGVEDEDGCPEDNDRDGIPDALDKCPNEAETYNGIDDEDGCPETTGVKTLVHVSEEKIEIKDSVYFKTGRAILEARSYVLLDQVVAVLRNFRHITKVRIEGHTDNQGARAKNLKLSQERAEAVRAYLIGKGIAKERLGAAGLGPDRPIATNKTAAGRDKNRRVEFVIVSQTPLGNEVKGAPPPAQPTHINGPGPVAPAAPAPGLPATPAPAPAPAAAPLLDLNAEPAPEAPVKAKGKGKRGKAGKKGKESEIQINF